MAGVDISVSRVPRRHKTPKILIAVEPTSRSVLRAESWTGQLDMFPPAILALFRRDTNMRSRCCSATLSPLLIREILFESEREREREREGRKFNARRRKIPGVCCGERNDASQHRCLDTRRRCRLDAFGFLPPLIPSPRPAILFRVRWATNGTARCRAFPRRLWVPLPPPPSLEPPPSMMVFPWSRAALTQRRDRAHVAEAPDSHWRRFVRAPRIYLYCIVLRSSHHRSGTSIENCRGCRSASPSLLPRPV
jgi:hypothetical protein